MKYLYGNELYSSDELEKLARDRAADTYDEMLDDCYEPYDMGGLTYYASDILKSCDPIAYDVGLDDYADSLLTDIRYEAQEIEILEYVIIHIHDSLQGWRAYAYGLDDEMQVIDLIDEKQYICENIDEMLKIMIDEINDMNYAGDDKVLEIHYNDEPYDFNEYDPDLVLL